MTMLAVTRLVARDHLRLCSRYGLKILQATKGSYSSLETWSSTVMSTHRGGRSREVHTDSGSHSDKYTPRRAMMYIPGDSEKKISKIPLMNADCAVLDCEDGVAVNRKVEARQTISRMLDEIDFGRTEACVRVNSIQSGLVDEDLRVTLSAKRRPATLMLPKVDNTLNIESFTKSLDSVRVDTKFKLVIFVESAIGLLNLRSVCESCEKLTASGAKFVLDGIVFGSDDFVADIGATRTPEATEILLARQTVVLTAKAFGLQAIDIVHINFKDLESLRVQAIEGAQMGFTGKQCIHPTQVPVIQQAFAPSPERVEWATELIKAFEAHQASGKGAFTFRGHMIDMPLLLQAQNIVQLKTLLSE